MNILKHLTNRQFLQFKTRQTRTKKCFGFFQEQFSLNLLHKSAPTHQIPLEDGLPRYAKLKKIKVDKK